MSRIVYLAGPISGLTYEDAVSWRKHVSDLLRPFAITCLSPLRDGSYGSVNRGIILSPVTALRVEVLRDKWDVRRADIILVNLAEANQVSIGTCVEIGWADAWEKIVILVPPLARWDHGFLQHIPLRASSLDDAVRMILHFFGV